jgi:hypothetical protein
MSTQILGSSQLEFPSVFKADRIPIGIGIFLKYLTIENRQKPMNNKTKNFQINKV